MSRPRSHINFAGKPTINDQIISNSCSSNHRNHEMELKTQTLNPRNQVTDQYVHVKIN
uniref:Uncharacterized protein n=1 Tax=Arundo donax TaxID=35708 RepID=A0A0A9TFS4_ARUDO